MTFLNPLPQPYHVCRFRGSPIIGFTAPQISMACFAESVIGASADARCYPFVFVDGCGKQYSEHAEYKSNVTDIGNAS